MEDTAFLDRINTHYLKKLPFVLYSLPESTEVIAYLQKNSRLNISEGFPAQSFVMAHFNYENAVYSIAATDSEKLTITFTNRKFQLTDIIIPESTMGMENHIQLVNKALHEIEQGKASKIVVSRSKRIKLRRFDLKNVINGIIRIYPTAFRYVWYHPDLGLWCGASPETLVKVDDICFTTMAMAGTKKQDGTNSPKWTSKERDEQQIVTNDITKNLGTVTQIIKVSKPYTEFAGSLAHIRTDISGILKKGRTTLESIVSVLHPTPAVCGSPTKFANDFVNENEGYNREFYTGFLGPIMLLDDTSSLFVNLRCMKLNEDSATLFVGGGITAASIPLNEWNETQDKLQTMGQVLQPLL